MINGQSHNDVELSEKMTTTYIWIGHGYINNCEHKIITRIVIFIIFYCLTKNGWDIVKTHKKVVALYIRIFSIKKRTHIINSCVP